MATTEDKETQGPYIVWTDYGGEGWQPTSYKDKEAVAAAILRSHEPICVTKKLEVEVKVQWEPEVKE